MKKKVNKQSLSTKALLLLIIFAVAVIILSALGISHASYGQLKDDYKKYSFSFTRTAADCIDGDAVKRYYETNRKDDYYYETLEYLKVAVKRTNLKYFYVFVPLENEIVYIWDSAESESECALGSREEYSAKEKDAVMMAFSKEPTEKFTRFETENYEELFTAYSPIYDSSGEPVAIVAVVIESEGFENRLYAFVVMIVISVIAASIPAMFITYKVMRRYLIKPIYMINDSARHMVSDLKVENSTFIDLHTGDELEDLADSFNDMNIELRKYLKSINNMTAEKERINTELSLAANIQSSMLPGVFPPFPERTEFEIFASMAPAKEVGGDFYDFFFTDDDHLALVIADVSGKGVPAALFMMSSKIFINVHTQRGGSPAEILDRVNKQICSENEAHMFVTVWLGILEISTGRLTASNAGHEYPMLNRDGKFEKLGDKHGLAVGMFSFAKYTDYEITLKNGDSLFVYTDGVAEATDSEEQLFGLERTLDALNKQPEASAEILLKNVREAVDGFVKDAPQFDDMTMLGFKYFGMERKE